MKSFIKSAGIDRFQCDPIPEINNITVLQNKQLITSLRKNDIKTIVVHKDDLTWATKFYFPECQKMRMQTNLLLPQLLVPNPNVSTQIMALFFPADPKTGNIITFPDRGTFTIQGVEAYPADWFPIHLFLDGKEIKLKQEWIDRGGKISTFEPNLKLNIEQNSKLEVRFDKNQNTDYSFIKLWYTYNTQLNTPQLDQTKQIIKIYEDNEAAVFKIN